jgi:hypothetical protein
LAHLPNLSFLCGDDRLGEIVQFVMLSPLQGITGHGECAFVVGDHCFDESLLEGRTAVSDTHRSHIHLHATGWGKIGIPGVAPGAHLLDFGLLRTKNGLGKLPDFGAFGRLKGLLRHGDSALVVDDHAINELRIVGYVARVRHRGVMIHPGHAWRSCR